MSISNIFDLFGGRKFGIVGAICGVLLAFIGTNTMTDPRERMVALIIIGVLAGFYVIGNILQKKLINNGGDEDAKVDTVYGPISPPDAGTPF